MDYEKKGKLLGLDSDPEKIFNFNFLIDNGTVQYVKNHGRIMFIVRGPPGGGKSMLTKMIEKTYENAEVCSADHYHDLPFVSKYSDSRTFMKKAHEYCASRAEEACNKNKHPLIIQNTHIRLWEMIPYINLALKYNYTVIFAETVKKIKVDAKTLAKTNKYRLGTDYVNKRMSGWQEYIPLYMGWFLSPADGKHIQELAFELLKSIEKDEVLKNVFPLMKADEELSVRSLFKDEKFVFCMESFYNNGSVTGSTEHYLSSKIQDAYGKMFELKIQGIILSKKVCLALVSMDAKQKDLIMKADAVEDPLERTFQRLSIKPFPKSSFEIHNSELTNHNVKQEPKHHDTEFIDTNMCNFIVLAHAKGLSTGISVIDSVKSFKCMLFSGSEIINSNGTVMPDRFCCEVDNCKVYKLNNCLLVTPTYNISVKSIFTGLYIV